MEIIDYTDEVQIMISLFKKRDFLFIVESKKGIHEKQRECLELLTDEKVQELLYGGAAGGAKSWTGVTWLMFMCLAYPGTKWFIGREDLTRITKSTLITFYKAAKFYGVRNEIDFKFNGQSNVIHFSNGSSIDLLNLIFQPRDPMYERFGSMEYTGGWLEEGGEINFGAFDVLRTRVGRHMNDHYGIKAILFITCNPKKNWMYSEFYKPSKENKLLPYQKFLAAFVQDNPFIESGYLDQLKRTKDKAKKERLLKGNWDYDDNPYKLCTYDNILAIFTNNHIPESKEYFLTADIARFGSDYARIGVWRGWNLIEVHSFAVSATTEIQACIEAMRKKYGIPVKNCIADEDGVGGGVVDNCKIVGFSNNSSPFEEKISEGQKDKPNYQNLQTQCLYKLADIINENAMFISAEISEQDKETIKLELDTIEADPSKQPVLALVNKKVIKENIGHSPDWRDMIMMRKYFDYKHFVKTNYAKFGFA